MRCGYVLCASCSFCLFSRKLVLWPLFTAVAAHVAPLWVLPGTVPLRNHGRGTPAHDCSGGDTDRCVNPPRHIHARDPASLTFLGRVARRYDTLWLMRILFDDAGHRPPPLCPRPIPLAPVLFEQAMHLSNDACRA